MPDDYCGPERRSKISPDCVAATKSAKLAVKEVFALLGVNVDVPKEVEDFRKSLRFGDSLRSIAERSGLAFVGAISIAIATLLYYGIKVALSR